MRAGRERAGGMRYRKLETRDFSVYLKMAFVEVSLFKTLWV